MRSNRDRAVGTTGVATLAIGTGLGVASGLLQFSDSTKGAGNAIGFAAGGLSTLLSFRSLRQQRRGKRPAWVLPDMLSPFFGMSQEQHGHYPNAIWAYLNSAPREASQTSGRERILAEWLGAGRFGPQDSPQGKAKIALLTETKAANKKLSINLLSERSAMLADVPDEMSLMKRDVTILLAAQAGQLELNVMVPVVAFNLLHQIEILKNAVDVFVKFCVTGITADEERCKGFAEASVSLVTALTPHIGYFEAAQIAKEYLSSGKSIRQIVLEKGLMTKEKLDKVFDLRGMTEPGLHHQSRGTDPSTPSPMC